MSQAPARQELSVGPLIDENVPALPLEGKPVSKHLNEYSFKKGEIHNPLGSVTAGGRIQVGMNRFSRLDHAELQEVFDDSTRPIAEIIAARQLLDCVRDDYLGLHNRESTQKHTEGMPVARVIVERVDSASASDKLAELMRLCGQPDTVKRVESHVVGEGEAEHGD